MLFEFDVLDNRKDIYDAEEGFLNGNMFSDLYDAYKNYKVPNIIVKSEKDAWLYKLMMLDFAINDLNLYLILNPNCKEKYKLFTEYISIYKKLKDEYEKKYQVLELCDDTLGKYTYNSNPWPWEVDYV